MKSKAKPQKNEKQTTFIWFFYCFFLSFFFFGFIVAWFRCIQTHWIPRVIIKWAKKTFLSSKGILPFFLAIFIAISKAKRVWPNIEMSFTKNISFTFDTLCSGLIWFQLIDFHALFVPRCTCSIPINCARMI